ncbi:MAG: UbiA family prenyltransferase [Gammaproteobacteria bacterium]|nr:UbiA family prenyltransferase [Gammaproteobacteria bacterium]
MNAQVNAPTPPEAETQLPLCVDLDGTLTPVDTLHETALALARLQPLALLALPRWLAGGRARLKHELSQRVQIDVSHLPYRRDLLEWLRSERSRGRRLVLATAADRRIAEAVAAHLGLFDEVIATDAGDNLAGAGKRAALVRRFGEQGFDYVGDDPVDLKVWPAARQAIVVGDAGLAARAARLAAPGPVFATAPASPELWLKAARLYQWVKNLLILVPALLSHRIAEAAVLREALLAFLAFGLCASSVYLINDLLDLDADRRHPRKRRRPFASGALPARQGALAALLLALAAAAVALEVGLAFSAVLAAYYACTGAYSLRLKRAPIVDVMMLAGLYTIRIVAGGVATGVEVTFWLLAFSMFMFLSLAVVKRYAELHDAARAGLTQAAGRGYGAADLPLLLALGTASGFAAIVVLALYINSPQSQALYGDPRPLWLICPLLLYWVCRVWLLTTRGRMHDDPILFAMRDRTSLLIIGLMALTVLAAV